MGATNRAGSEFQRHGFLGTNKRIWGRGWMWWSAVMILVPFIVAERRWRGEETVAGVGGAS
jgi:hypothetical protein